MIKCNFKAAYYQIYHKDWDTLIEQSPVTSIPIGHTPLTKFVNLWAKLGCFEQNIEQNRSEKRIAGTKNRWEKSKIDSPLPKIRP